MDKLEGRLALDSTNLPPAPRVGPAGQSLTAVEDDKGPAQLSVRDGTRNADSGIRVRGYVHGTPVNFLFDTGTDVTIISPRVHRSIPETTRPELRPTTLTLKLADGSPFPFMGRGVFEVRLGPKTVEHEVRVADDEGECNIGNRIFKTSPMFLRCSKGRSVVGCKENGKVPDHLAGLIESCARRLDEHQQKQLRELLTEYADVFSRSPDDLGRTTVVHHTIDTGTTKPIKQPFRRVPLHQRQVVTDLLQEMFEAGVVKPTSSVWSSPVVLVKKKNGQIRFCVDYRKVNAATMKDSYPIPRITESADALNGSRWFSTLDLASGYWQVGMAEKDERRRQPLLPVMGYSSSAPCRVGCVMSQQRSKDSWIACFQAYTGRRAWSTLTTL
ncbi:hypothetical protein HOLleu_25640 [Holothuria leucospilota]|uniref:Peptidase A2 domain-containing protein n=1 Tax=Holothuria leucospilota TaxID=206669 RepID=A0A9Q1BSV0_HOLLE|nr:hypothetical protein HOLleu_25640 [Holothuria leucospilota]